MNVTNSIIQAFQLGQRQKLEREELKLRKEQEENDRKAREAALKEQQHQFDEQQKTAKAHFDALQSLREITQKFKRLEEGKKAQESYVKTGLVAPGYNKTISGSEDILENKDVGVSFQVPMDAAEQVAERERILTSPKIENKIKEIQERENLIGFRQSQLEQDKIAGRVELQSERLKSLADISEKRNKNLFEIAKLRTQATVQAAQIRGAKSGAKLRPISDKQVEELAGVDVLTTEFSELKEMLIARPDFLQAPVSGGIANMVNSLTRGEPKEFQDIRAKQASIISAIGHKLYGSALTHTEVSRLTAEMGALGRGESLESGLSKINNAISLLQLKKQERLKYLEAGGRDVSGIKTESKSTSKLGKGKYVTEADGSRTWVPEK